MDQLFKLVWRNSYLRNCIHIQLSLIKTIMIRYLYQLENKYQYLKTLDRRSNRILYDIKSDVEHHLFINSPYRHLVTHLIVAYHLLDYYRFNKDIVIYGVSIQYNPPSFDFEDIPKTVKYIRAKDESFLCHFSKIASLTFLDITYRKFIKPITIPQLRYLRLRSSERITLTKGIFPQSLTYLKVVGPTTCCLKDMIFPSNLKYLDLGYQFNGVLSEQALPNGLRYLDLGDNREHVKINSIPKSVVSLRMGTWFKQNIEPDLLPSNLTYLNLGNSFKQRISQGVLTQSLKTLVVGFGCRSLTFNDHIPSSVTTYIANNYKENDEPIFIPPNSENIRLYIDSQKSYTLPPIPNCKSLLINTEALQLLNEPKSLFTNCLTTLSFGFNRVLVPGDIPQSVTNLSINAQGILPNTIPSSVKTLELALKSDWTPINIIPDSVTKLIIGEIIQLEQLEIPTSVTKLVVKNTQTNLQKINVPSSVTSLSSPKPFKNYSLPNIRIIKSQSYNQRELFHQLGIKEDSFKHTPQFPKTLAMIKSISIGSYDLYYFESLTQLDNILVYKETYKSKDKDTLPVMI
ncbi:hypothetical protein CYY_004916 [Polysphondylium violaceum]|uniref:FNIP repeat-containing protein n=1 Tax=Polysphondylium violaceum TaxID=133409 RepID=A0A8J4PVR1_9MYCE|nr:hypothetical protein CYY_004916 [Polysphondylium violaceum]